MRLAEALHLGGILDRLGQLGGVNVVNHAHRRGHTRPNQAVDDIQVHHHRGIFRQFLRIFIDAGVGADGHAVLLEMRLNLRAENGGVDEQHRIGHRHGSKGQHNGRAVHIVAAQVHQPAHVHQRRQDKRIRAKAFHFAAHLMQLLLTAASRQRYGQFPRGFCRQCRALRPDFIQQINIRNNFALLLFRNALITLVLPRRDDSAVKAQRLTGFKRLFDVLRNRRDARLAHLAQLDAAAFQLLPRLQEIAAIRPQTRPVRRHHQRTCAAREAGNIVPPAEVRADVLRRVEIIRGDDIEVDAVRLHGAAKLR